jgi:predicted nucleotidyltransferase
MILDSEQSKNIVDRLRRELHPLKIILFGFQTRGNATSQESDVDLCVVVPDDAEHSYKKAVRAYNKSLRGLRIPKDIIVRHQSKFEEISHWLNSLEGEISRTGSPLYSVT